MDAFFASVELLRYPQLKGLPVVIGGGRRKVDELLLRGPDGTEERERRFIPVEDFPLLKDYVGRGVITTATYPARQFGVGSAMGMMKAAKLCPQAIVLPVDFDEVRRFSRLFKSTITEIAPVMQDRGWTRCTSTSPTCPAASAKAGGCWRGSSRKASLIGPG